jgi:hypothetical protein
VITVLSTILAFVDMLHMNEGVLRQPLVLLFPSNTILYPSVLLLSVLILCRPLDEPEPG